MNEAFFFEIPIYRCSLSAHTLLTKNYEEKVKLEVPKDKFPEYYKHRIDSFYHHEWYGWKYNEIIGYLNLYILGNQFRAEIWKVDKKRLNKGITKKNFKYIGKALESTIPKNLSTEDIFNFMCDKLEHLNNTDFRKFTFDLETFKKIGQFVNWKLLIEKLNPNVNPNFRKDFPPN